MPSVPGHRLVRGRNEDVSIHPTPARLPHHDSSVKYGKLANKIYRIEGQETQAEVGRLREFECHHYHAPTQKIINKSYY